MEIAQIIDNALEEWYSERGRPVPQWKKERQQWWREYLLSLGLPRYCSVVLIFYSLQAK